MTMIIFPDKMLKIKLLIPNLFEKIKYACSLSIKFFMDYQIIANNAIPGIFLIFI